MHKNLPKVLMSFITLNCGGGVTQVCQVLAPHEESHIHQAQDARYSGGACGAQLGRDPI